MAAALLPGIPQCSVAEGLIRAELGRSPSSLAERPGTRCQECGVAPRAAEVPAADPQKAAGREEWAKVRKCRVGVQYICRKC